MAKAKKKAFIDAPQAPAPAVLKSPVQRGQVEVGVVLDHLSALKYCEKVVVKKATEVYSAVRGRLYDHFTDYIYETRHRPTACTARGEQSEATAELRKRSGSVELDPETVQQLHNVGVSTTMREVVPERLVLNPELSQKDLEELARSIDRNPKLRNKNIVLRQKSVTRTTLSETVLEELAQSEASREEINELLDKVATIAVSHYKFDAGSNSIDVLQAVRLLEEDLK